MKLGRLGEVVAPAESKEEVAPAVRGEVANFRGKIAAAGLSLALAGGSFLPQEAEAGDAKCGAITIILTEDGQPGVFLKDPRIIVKDENGAVVYSEGKHSTVLKDLLPGTYTVEASAENDGKFVSGQRPVMCSPSVEFKVPMAMDKPEKK